VSELRRIRVVMGSSTSEEPAPCRLHEWRVAQGPCHRSLQWRKAARNLARAQSETQTSAETSAPGLPKRHPRMRGLQICALASVGWGGRFARPVSRRIQWYAPQDRPGRLARKTSGVGSPDRCLLRSQPTCAHTSNASSPTHACTQHLLGCAYQANAIGAGLGRR
jgi:hypothetical protein